MNDNNINIREVDTELTTYEIEGKTAMLIARDGKYQGIVAVADTIKENAAEAIEQMEKDGLDVVMLTGDNERTANAIAKQVGIDHVIAQVLPEEKADKVRGIQDRKSTRLNSSHVAISYAVFCLKKKKKQITKENKRTNIIT